MYKDIIFDNIVVEVTRRCNMSCPHCMRGDAENIDIDLEKLDKFLYQFKDKYIRFLFFTGGEPTLNIEAVKFTIDKVIEYNITVAHVSLISNGKNLSDKCIDCINSFPYFLTYISQDKYHEKLTDKDYAQLSKLKRVAELQDFLVDNSDVVKKGRAAENNLGVCGKPDISFRFSTHHDYLVLLTKLLCTCNGDIIPTCDYSFSEVEDFKFCNYDDDIMDLVYKKSLSSKFIRLEYSKQGAKLYKYFDWLKRTGHEL